MIKWQNMGQIFSSLTLIIWPSIDHFYFLGETTVPSLANLKQKGSKDIAWADNIWSNIFKIDLDLWPIWYVTWKSIRNSYSQGVTSVPSLATLKKRGQKIFGLDPQAQNFFSKWGIKRAYVLKANYNWDKFVYYFQKFECNLNSHLCCKSYSSETCIQINYWVQHVLSKSMHWHGSLLCTGKFKISMSEDNSFSKENHFLTRKENLTI